jgi:5-methyltetrahydrofolate--homocysteine methyltransferase
MPIHFSRGRWQQIRTDAADWWAGTLERPLIQMVLRGGDPGRPEPEIPSHEFTAFYDLDVPAEAIGDRWDYDLSCCRLLGGAFPSVWPNFGPGVVAAFLGATLSRGSQTCWFRPPEIRALDEIRFEYDPENRWLRRIEEICRCAVERWEGRVQVGMTDLGGTLDVLSTFRPAEHLPLDLYDHPQDVNRITWELHELWWRYFETIDAVLQPANPGYTAWTPVFSSEPSYMLQCDFCYMLGPDTFEAFVKPELTASCRRLVNPFYHLDGPGQLVHLDSLLEIEELKGVQWIPGAGSPGFTDWPEVYSKIHAAGKRIQLWGGAHTLAALVEQIGTPRGVLILAEADISAEAEGRRSAGAGCGRS